MGTGRGRGPLSQEPLTSSGRTSIDRCRVLPPFLYRRSSPEGSGTSRVVPGLDRPPNRQESVRTEPGTVRLVSRFVTCRQLDDEGRYGPNILGLRSDGRVPSRLQVREDRGSSIGTDPDLDSGRHDRRERPRDVSRVPESVPLRGWSDSDGDVVVSTIRASTSPLVSG